MSSIKILFILTLIGTLIIGCFPDRHPTNPLEFETRRPQVAYFAPMAGAFIVDDSDSLLLDPKTMQGEMASKANSVQIWFDELMEQESISPAFELSLAVDEEAWTKIQSVAALAQSQDNPNFMLVGLRNRGALFSNDGGASWNFMNSLADRTIKFFQIDPQNSSSIYADTDSTLLKSLDGGVVWHRADNGLPENVQITRLDFDPINSDKLWLGTNKGIFTSDNGGESWQAAGSLPNWREDKPVSKISVDPLTTTTIYCATLGRYIYKSVDNGVTWEMLRTGLPTSNIYDVVIDPDSSSILYAATINRGVYKSLDGGLNWFETNSELNDVNARKLLLDPQNSQRLFVVTPNRIFKSENKAQQWEEISIPASVASIVDFSIDPIAASTWVMATPNSMFKTQNAGNSWQEINSINTESIKISGTFSYTTWQDTIRFILANGDTIEFSPHRYNDVLAMYDAGLVAEPPEGIDPNPKAMQVEFEINSDQLFSNWMYRLEITGAFEGSDWRGRVGARDIHGMSLEYDYVAYIKNR